jgi:tetratricopeptide (TPR) repeat protein
MPCTALNNIGDDLRKAGRLGESLGAFRDARVAYERSGRADRARIARWQVANVLRLMGQLDEALSMQSALEREAQVAGQPDPFVFDELALLHAARGEADKAAQSHARAAALRAKPR